MGFVLALIAAIGTITQTQLSAIRTATEDRFAAQDQRITENVSIFDRNAELRVTKAEYVAFKEYLLHLVSILAERLSDIEKTRPTAAVLESVAKDAETQIQRIYELIDGINDKLAAQNKPGDDAK